MTNFNSYWFTLYGYCYLPNVKITNFEFCIFTSIAFALKVCVKSFLSLGGGTGQGYT